MPRLLCAAELGHARAKERAADRRERPDHQQMHGEALPHAPAHRAADVAMRVRQTSAPPPAALEWAHVGTP